MNPPITPGEILLEEYLKPLGISQNAMARAIGVSPRAVNEIVLGKRAITPAISIRFGVFFAQSDHFWRGIQTECVSAPSPRNARDSWTIHRKVMGLDAVELVIAVEQEFGIAIPDAVAAKMITPAHLIAHVQDAVGARSDRKTCISLKAFHRVRAGLMKATGVKRSEVTLETPISSLFTGSRRTELWSAFKRHASLPALPDLCFGVGRFFSPKSVNDLVSVAITQNIADLREEQSWTNEEVRQVVRHIISEQLGIKKFEDTDEFVRDLGID